MKNLVCACFCILFIVPPLLAQSVGGRWFELHDSGLDTLTGVAGDSTLEEVSLKKAIYFPGGQRGAAIDMVPRALLIVTQFTDIANGEGVTQRDGFGDNRRNLYSGLSTLDTLATAPTADDNYQIVDVISNPGDAYKYSLKQYPSAVDTDSLAVRRYIYGIW